MKTKVCWSRGYFVCALALSVLSGCGGEPDFQGIVDASLDFTADLEATSSMTVLLLEPAFAAFTLEDITAGVAFDVQNRLGTCASPVVEGSTVAFVFDACARDDGPPWGIRELRGGLTATYSMEADFTPTGWVKVAIQGAVTLNGRPLTLDIHAQNAVSRDHWVPGDPLAEDRHTVRIDNPNPPSGNSDLVTALLWAKARYGDADCAENEQSPPRLVAYDGYLDVGADQSAQTAGKSYHRCGGSCPAADGLVTTETFEETIEIAFDGTNTASAKRQPTAGGSTESMAVALECTQ